MEEQLAELAAKVAAFIDKMLSEWYEKDEKNAFIQELNGFLSFILKTHKDTFNNLDLDIQNQSIELINNGEITSLSKRLSNSTFTEKAPIEVVSECRIRLGEAQSQANLVRSRLSSIE